MLSAMLLPPRPPSGTTLSTTSSINGRTWRTTVSGYPPEHPNHARSRVSRGLSVTSHAMQAVAIGAARAVRALKSEAVHVTNETLARVVGPRIYQEWTSRDFAFKGASGWVEFMPNGDRNATSMNVNFKNYDRRKDPNNTAEGMTSAALWMGDKGLRFSADGFHWGHGRVARPSDRPPSSSSMPWYFTLGIIFCSFLILLGALYLIYLIWGDYRARKSQAALQIDFGELVFGEPVTVLGAGTTGLSLVATYRGLPVVVKQIGTIR